MASLNPNTVYSHTLVAFFCTLIDFYKFLWQVKERRIKCLSLGTNKRPSRIGLKSRPVTSYKWLNLLKPIL